MSELKPCPFCGSDKIEAEGWSSKDSSGPACDDCGGSAGIPHDTPAQNAAAWNRRAADVDLGRERAEAAGGRVPRKCTMGVGCDEAGVCYATAHGQPERCESHNAIRAAVLAERKRCAALASAHAHHALWAGVAPYGTYGMDTNDKTLENFGMALTRRIAKRISGETRDELGARLLREGKITQAEFDANRAKPVDTRKDGL